MKVSAEEALLHEWVRKAQNGDEGAFTRLLEVLAPKVFALAVRYLGDAMEAEDVVQETFLRAYANLWTVDPERPFWPWLATIAIRLCIDRLRRRRKDVALETLPYIGAWGADPEPTPEEAALERERAERIRRLVLQLPPRERAVVVLHYWEGMDLRTLAELLGWSPSAVKSLLYRARKRLERAWKQTERPSRSAET